MLIMPYTATVASYAPAGKRYTTTNVTSQFCLVNASPLAYRSSKAPAYDIDGIEEEPTLEEEVDEKKVGDRDTGVNGL